MKLNPPASSSDLDIAREIAQRLHQPHGRGVGPTTTAFTASAEVAAAPTSRSAPPPQPTPPPLPPPRPAAARSAASLTPPPLPAPAPAPAVAPQPPAPAAAEPAPEWDQAPPPPSWDEAPEAPSSDDLEIEVPSGAPGQTIEPDARSPFDAASLSDVGSGSVPLEVDVDELGTPPDGNPLGETPSPFDTEMDPPPEPAPEDLFGEPPPPSWDDVIEACFQLSDASGAMLIDPAGQVFAARGEWPDPGAEAIAAKLVPMLDRTLRDAPTRSVSAPVAGRHLTAWRVPLAEGLVTVAFVGQAPLRAEIRPVIDEQIHRGAGG